MSYVVLARKYRPQQFTDLVGQNPVSQTLVNAIESGRIAHAYVFSGPRGIGKTTTARLLAKCLNCEKGPTKSPCDKCASCESIAQGSSMQDVMEIDGASNRGIEQIRELRDSAKYAPTSSRYRIFIIDEAHQITKDAFGALLKTLEEPPAHVVFMMATTEVQKIPAPILSRCQRFSLRPISPERVFDHLKSICKQEKIKVDEQALHEIVRFVEGSMRDALSLLDQAVVFSPKGVTTDTLKDLLGLLPSDLIQTTANHINDGEPAPLLQFIQSTVQSGVDLTQLAKNLQEYYHAVLLAKAGVENPLNPQAETYQEAAKKYDYSVLERNIRLLAKGIEEMRRSDTPRAIFEMTVLQMAQKTLDPRELIERLQQLEAQLAKGGQQIAAPRPLSRPQNISSTPIQTTNRPQAIKSSYSQPKTIKPSTEPTSNPSKNPEASSQSSVATALSKEELHAGWENFIAVVSEEKQSLAAALEESIPTFNDSGLTLVFNKQFNKQMADRSEQIIQKLLEKHYGSRIGIRTIYEPSAAPIVRSTPRAASPTPAPRPSVPAAISRSPEFDPVAPEEAGSEAQSLMKHFPGQLKKRRPTE